MTITEIISYFVGVRYVSVNTYINDKGYVRRLVGAGEMDETLNRRRKKPVIEICDRWLRR
jgi:hypothetical protein